MERRIYCHREQGLSPRVRGNQPVHDDANIRLGSIPARAGEPVLDQPFPLEIRVYPRACGGTLWPVPRSGAVAGLSPRVRGNQLITRLYANCIGSIPARAGEPGTWGRCTRAIGVYPRACGGTMPKGEHDTPGPGLSPRVRGNHAASVVPHAGSGSIPARAGEPLVIKSLNYLQFQRARRDFGRPYLRFTSKIPSASTISFGGSPRVSMQRFPTAFVSRQTRTTDPVPRASHHADSTSHTRVRTPADRSGAT